MLSGHPSGHLSVVRPSVCCPSVNRSVLRDTVSLYLVEGWHKYSASEWTLLKRFSRSEVKGVMHDSLHYINILTYLKVKVTAKPNALFAAEVFMLTVWHVGRLVFADDT